MLLGWQIFKDAQSLYADAITNKIVYVDKANSFLEGPLKRFIPIFYKFEYTFRNYLIGSWAISAHSFQHLKYYLIFLVTIALFFLKDNLKIKTIIRN